MKLSLDVGQDRNIIYGLLDCLFDNEEVLTNLFLLIYGNATLVTVEDYPIDIGSISELRIRLNPSQTFIEGLWDSHKHGGASVSIKRIDLSHQEIKQVKSRELTPPYMLGTGEPFQLKWDFTVGG